MQYYSEKTKRLYNTIKELESAESEYDKKQKEIELAKKERSEAAKKVEELRELAHNAADAYQQELSKFCDKYGSYHTTIVNPDGTKTRRPGKILEDLIDLIDFSNFFGNL